MHGDLVRVCERAIAICIQDFAVHDGIRTREEQAQLVHRGASRLMNSKHLPQADGLGHAVDLVPFVNGKLRWEWELIYPIAEAMRKSAEALRVRIRWGGDWQELTGDQTPPHIRVRNYVNKRRANGKDAFIDGPHFELML